MNFELYKRQILVRHTIAFAFVKVTPTPAVLCLHREGRHSYIGVLTWHIHNNARRVADVLQAISQRSIHLRFVRIIVATREHTRASCTIKTRYCGTDV